MRFSRSYRVCCAAAIFLTGACADQRIVGPARYSPAPVLTAADYDRAFSLRDHNLAAKVFNADIVPRWIGAGDKFWHAVENADGLSYRLVTSETGESRPLFDHGAVAEALSDALAVNLSGEVLPIRITEFNEKGKTLTALYEDVFIRCTVADVVACGPVNIPAPEAGLLVSPDGTKAAFTRERNIWLRNLATGEERALTDDGVDHYAWGKKPDTSQSAVPEQRDGLVTRPHASLWSPDGRKLIVVRTDERDVGVYPFVEWAPLDGFVRPKLYQLRIPILGDPLPRRETAIIDIGTGTRGTVAPGEGFSIEPGGFVGWDKDYGRGFFIAQNYGRSAMRLVEYSNGKTRLIHEETSDAIVRTNHALYNVANVRLIKGGREVLWFSERSGWGHLYRIDTVTGEVLNVLTKGDWTVLDIMHIDEEKERVFFTAGGRESGTDPYYRHLYRVNFDGSDLTLLTPEAADHNFDGAPSFLILNAVDVPTPEPRISPDGRFIVSSYSTMDTPPVTVLRSAEDGRIISQLGKADVSELLATGYRPAERFSAIAADGKTTIYGSIYLPPNFDPTKSYPVINALYAGPQVRTASIDYMEAISGLSGQVNRTALASLGFVVVTVDGRGTPFRSLDFQMASYGVGHGTATLEDHRAALEQLATDRPFMDLSRVGVYGHSWGGYHAARAILLHNDFYDAAVSSAGVHGWQWMYPGFEPAIGVPDYGGGSVIRPAPDAVPDDIALIGNTSYADRLKGRLLLMYGDLDENVPPSQSVHMINALIAAGKDFDVLYMPSRSHYIFGLKYVEFRIWNYLVEHVMGAAPPDYVLDGQ